MCLCVLPALCALRGKRECVWPEFDHNSSEKTNKADHTLPVFLTEESESGRQEKKRKLIKTTDLTFDVLYRNTRTEKNKIL